MTIKNIEKKIQSFLGLVFKSGNIISGEDATLLEVKKKKVSLVLVATDASDNTKKLFRDKCNYRNIENIEFLTKTMIGDAIGKSPRAVIGIKDKKIAEKIRDMIQNC